MKNKILVAVFSMFLVVSIVAGVASYVGGASPVQAEEAKDKNAISVNGSHTIKVAPDVAYISLGIKTLAKEPSVAQSENAKKMDAVQKKLLDLGIQKEDIETTNYNMREKYEYKKDERVFIGYEVTNTIRVTVKNLDSVGNIIDMSIKEGINQTGGLSFGISDEVRDEQYLVALKKAVENAKGKAMAIAGTVNVKLNNPTKIVEGTASIPQPMYREYGAMKDEMVTGDGVSTPIAAGELEIRANVSVVYEY